MDDVAGLPPLLVSLHMPKTAGTSFSTVLRSGFGDRYCDDYDTMPMQVWRARRHAQALAAAIRLRRAGVAPGIDCVHGHFLPIKYRLGIAGRRPLRFITWLRDPVERAISHYHFWRREYAGDDPHQPLRNRMLTEDWSLERFTLGPEMRNLYRQYLWGFRPGLFSFIGVTERYEADLERLARLLPGLAVLSASQELVNPARKNERYAITPDLRHRIERHHAADVSLYRRVLGRREAGSG